MGHTHRTSTEEVYIPRETSHHLTAKTTATSVNETLKKPPTTSE